MESSNEASLPPDAYRHVLLVSDDRRGALAHALRGKNFDVSVSRTPEAALAAIAGARFDAVLLDPLVPRDARLVVQRSLRQRLPVVVAKGWTQQGGVETLVARVMALVAGPSVREAETPASRAPEAAPRGPSRTSPSAKTILVVDDDRDVVRAMLRTLARVPATTLSTGSLTHAVELLENVAVDLVVADYSLGAEGTGLDLLEIVRRKHPHTRRILVTGHSIEDECLPGDFSAADRILPKPWDADAVVGACHALLGLPAPNPRRG